MTKNLPQQVKYSNARSSLTKRDRRELMIAVSKLTPAAILTAREFVNDIQASLDESKGTLDFLESECENEKKIAWIEDVRNRISVTEAALSNIIRMPTIGYLKIKDEQALADEVEWLILDTVEYFDVNKEVLVITAGEIALEIIHNYMSMTLEDLMLCFKYAKDGRYGDLYNRLDGQIIKSWLAQYWEDLQAASIERNDQKAVQSKELKRTVSEEASHRWFNPKRIKESAKAAGADA